jgi:hypothetical protein
MAQHPDRIESVSAFVVEIPRDVPYLGPLRPGEFVNRRGYIVRQGNRTLYPTADRSVVLRITTEAGLTGWGETYGIVAPEAVRAIIEDVVAPVLEGRDPSAAGRAGLDPSRRPAACDDPGLCLRPAARDVGGTRDLRARLAGQGFPGLQIRRRCRR